MNTIDDYDEWQQADPRIEDSWFWTCPKCDAVNDHLLGSGEFVRCWRCRSTFKLEDGGGPSYCWPCFDCGGSGNFGVADGVLCPTCKGSGVIVAPHDLAALHIAAYRLNRQMAALSAAITPFLLEIVESIRRAFDSLASSGYFRLYPPPTKRKNGRQRSRREQRDIRQQRKRKPYGVWPRDHAQLM